MNNKLSQVWLLELHQQHKVNLRYMPLLNHIPDSVDCIQLASNSVYLSAVTLF